MTDIPQEIIDDYRDVNVDHEWWDFLESQFREEMEGKGIEIKDEQVYFSGFYCQGDGASFAGDINMTDFLKAHPTLLDSFPHHKEMFGITPDAVGLTVSGGGRYSHEYSMSLNAYYCGLEDYFDLDTPLGRYAAETLEQGIEKESEKFEEDVIEICRDYARNYYKSLQKEFEHLTSDEAVKEWLVANEIVEAA